MSIFKKLFGKKPVAQVEATAAPAARARQTSPASPAADSRTGSEGRVINNLKSFPFDVVGESNYQKALEKIAGGFRRDTQAVDVTAKIVLDPTNSYDENAVRVEIDKQTVGFLPADEALRIGGMMREQGVHAAVVEAQLRGGWRTNQHDKGHFGVKLKMTKSGWVDFGVGASKPPKV